MRVDFVPYKCLSGLNLTRPSGLTLFCPEHGAFDEVHFPLDTKESLDKFLNNTRQELHDWMALSILESIASHEANLHGGKSILVHKNGIIENGEIGNNERILN